MNEILALSPEARTTAGILMGQGRTQPNALIWLVYAGALSLAAGAVTLGIGLLVS